MYNLHKSSIAKRICLVHLRVFAYICGNDDDNIIISTTNRHTHPRHKRTQMTFASDHQNNYARFIHI